MIKIKFLVFVLAVITAMSIFSGCSRSIVYSENMTKIYIDSKVEVRDDSYYMNYTELKNEADIIVQLNITDELTNKNSEITYNNKGEATAVVSRRNAKIVKVYKGDNIAVDDNIILSVNEGVSGDGIYYSSLSGNTLKQKDIYVMFLKKSGDEYTYCKYGRGNFNFTNFLDNKESDLLTAQFLLDCENEQKTELSERLVGLRVTGMLADETAGYEEKQIIKTNYADIAVQRLITENKDDYYYIVYDDTNEGSGLYVQLTNMDGSELMPVFE